LFEGHPLTGPFFIGAGGKPQQSAIVCSKNVRRSDQQSLSRSFFQRIAPLYSKTLGYHEVKRNLKVHTLAHVVEEIQMKEGTRL